MLSIYLPWLVLRAPKFKKFGLDGWVVNGEVDEFLLINKTQSKKYGLGLLDSFQFIKRVSVCFKLNPVVRKTFLSNSAGFKIPNLGGRCFLVWQHDEIRNP